MSDWFSNPRFGAGDEDDDCVELPALDGLSTDEESDDGVFEPHDRGDEGPGDRDPGAGFDGLEVGLDGDDDLDDALSIVDPGAGSTGGAEYDAEHEAELDGDLGWTPEVSEPDGHSAADWAEESDAGLFESEGLGAGLPDLGTAGDDTAEDDDVELRDALEPLPALSEDAEGDDEGPEGDDGFSAGQQPSGDPQIRPASPTRFCVELDVSAAGDGWPMGGGVLGIGRPRGGA